MRFEVPFSIAGYGVASVCPQVSLPQILTGPPCIADNEAYSAGKINTTTLSL